ncbi:MAG: PSD1 and planctomycete cytochrome C domain-containing protein, partial [Planctomycetales bacterium]
MRRLKRYPILLVCAIGFTLMGTVRASDPLLETDVLPILTKRCMGCHGGLKQEGELDLRTVPAMLKGGESGAAVKPGDLENSEMWVRIAADEMPEGKNKLSPQEKDAVRNWIAAGLPTVAKLRENQNDPLLPSGKKHPPRQVAEMIDQHIDRALATAKLKPVAIASDSAFLRRVYLDLTGRVPTSEQAASFLDDASADKREKLIDALLTTPEFGEQFGRTWRDWICPPELPSDANGGKQPHQEARNLGKWLGERFSAGESWDKIVRDILTVDGEIKNQPQVIFFGLVGQGGKETPDGSARAAASLFMGVQLQCAQCHDDPYRDWAQQDHWALAAFFNNVNGDFKKISESPDKNSARITIPKSAFRNSGTAIPAAFLGGEELPSGKGGLLRGRFVDWLTAKENPFFARAFSNRLWFYLFSRGIVNPIDDFRELNPPSHPALMNLLANEFAASGFDVRHLVRCVCNSQAYQRSSLTPSGTSPETDAALAKHFGRMPLRLMTADMLYDSLKLAYGDPKLDLRAVDPKDGNTSGESAPVGDSYLEFLRRFATNEEDAT